MAKKNKLTQAKRNRERSRMEQTKSKLEKRSIRNEEKKVLREDRQKGLTDGQDPDLIGIYPGPQPIQE